MKVVDLRQVRRRRAALGRLLREAEVLDRKVGRIRLPVLVWLSVSEVDLFDDFAEGVVGGDSPEVRKVVEKVSRAAMATAGDFDDNGWDGVLEGLRVKLAARSKRKGGQQ